MGVILTTERFEQDSAAYLSEILADPDDDTPRSVYADWLQDMDNPTLAGYGEFIATQLEIDRIQKTLKSQCDTEVPVPLSELGTGKKIRRLADLYGRQRELMREGKLEARYPTVGGHDVVIKGQEGGPLSKVVESWPNVDRYFYTSSGAGFWLSDAPLGQGLSAIRREKMCFHCQFRRGFVERLYCPMGHWERWNEWLLARLPVQQVWITDPSPQVQIWERVSEETPAQVAKLADGSREVGPAVILTESARVRLVCYSRPWLYKTRHLVMHDVVCWETMNDSERRQYSGGECGGTYCGVPTVPLTVARERALALNTRFNRYLNEFRFIGKGTDNWYALYIEGRLPDSVNGDHVDRVLQRQPQLLDPANRYWPQIEWKWGMPFNQGWGLKQPTNPCGEIPPGGSEETVL